jgi:hypothetical protein
MKLSSCCRIVKKTRVGNASRLRCKCRLNINGASRGHSMGYGEAGVVRPGEAFPSFEFGRVARVPRV